VLLKPKSASVSDFALRTSDFRLHTSDLAGDHGTADVGIDGQNIVVSPVTNSFYCQLRLNIEDPKRLRLLPMHPTVLLLQARYPEDPAKKEELDSFTKKLRLPPAQVMTYDLLEGPPSLEQVLNHDAVMMGGSGEFYVSKGNLPGFQELLDLLKTVAEIGHPMFASCFGFQCLVEALGGEIVHDPKNTEVGTYEIDLTNTGRDDPLLGSLPDSFPAQLGRKDRARRLPEGVPNLALSEASPYQAFRLPGKPVWAFQFHPELNRDENRLRFDRYMDGYAVHMSPVERQEAVERFKESPETETLLRRFLEVVFG